MSVTDYTDGFERWWKSYPKGRRKGKGAAFKSWQKHNLETRTGELVSTIQAQVERDDHFRKYTPLPTTYLNQGRYDDDVPTARVSHSVPDIQEPEYECSRWHSLSNRIFLMYLRHAGGLTDTLCARLLVEKQRVITEMGTALDEDIQGGMTEPDAVIAFVKMLCDRLDGVTGLGFKSRIVRG